MERSNYPFYSGVREAFRLRQLSLNSGLDELDCDIAVVVPVRT